MKPHEVFASLVASIMTIWQGNAGGFVFASLGCLILAFFLARASRREMKQLRLDLAKCNEKHAEADKEAALRQEQMSNLKMSLSALFTYCLLSGDRRLQGITLPDLLEGKVALRVVDPQNEDRRDSPIIAPSA